MEINEIGESKVDETKSNEESLEGGTKKVDDRTTSSIGLNQNSSQIDQNQDSKPAYPLPFNELVELINSGIELNESNLPGYKTIPEKLNSEKPSQPILANQANSGLKPWQIRSS